MGHDVATAFNLIYLRHSSVVDFSVSEASILFDLIIQVFDILIYSYMPSDTYNLLRLNRICFIQYKTEYVLYSYSIISVICGHNCQVMDKTMANSTTLSTPQNEVDTLMQSVADEAGIELKAELPGLRSR